MSTALSWGVIFDWDGVIVDSEKTHEEAWNRAAALYGFRHTHEDFKRHFGTKTEDAVRDILGWLENPEAIREFAQRKEEIYREVLADSGGGALPGVKDLLAGLAAAGFPCAVASSTPLLNIAPSIKRLGLGAYFQTIVTGDDVTRSKPDPEGFLLAARRIERDPNRCVVLEDSPLGIKAGKAAGMHVIGVATTHPTETLFQADLIVSGLDVLTIEQIYDLLGAVEST